jgi:hypothetical protein
MYKRTTKVYYKILKNEDDFTVNFLNLYSFWIPCRIKIDIAKVFIFSFINTMGEIFHDHDNAPDSPPDSERSVLANEYKSRLEKWIKSFFSRVFWFLSCVKGLCPAWSTLYNDICNSESRFLAMRSDNFSFLDKDSFYTLLSMTPYYHECRRILEKVQRDDNVQKSVWRDSDLEPQLAGLHIMALEFDKMVAEITLKNQWNYPSASRMLAKVQAELNNLLKHR